MDSSLRYLNPVLTDRVEHLKEMICGVLPTPPKLWKGMPSDKYNSYLEKYEIDLAKANQFNFTIKNLPIFAMRKSDNQKVKVTYAAMKDTLNELGGKVERIEIFKGTAYIKFNSKMEAKEIHDLINNMQMGNNILKTKVI